VTAQLEAYIKWVSQETGREIVINVSQDLGVQGMQAAIRDHPTHIHVLVSPDLAGERFEQSIAHEVTHGLLAHARNYCRFAPSTRPLTPFEADSASLLLTMIEDIVVNKILYDNDFHPFASGYLDTVEQETRSARKGRDYYSQFENPLFKDRFMVFRYIMAWGFLQYFPLDRHSRKVLRRFERGFANAYPSQYDMSNQMKEIILRHDIFLAEGHGRAIKEALEAWGLGELLDVRSG
jgi:hypothetical protein